MISYILIFISKIIENTLSTLRIIVVANGKKKIGAILNGIVSICWIFSTSFVIININKSILGITSFCLGSIIGSYFGSIIEEKMALGDVLLIFKLDINVDNIIKIINTYSKYVYNYDNYIFMCTKRKNVHNISKVIHKYDKSNNIISLKIKNID